MGNNYLWCYAYLFDLSVTAFAVPPPLIQGEANRIPFLLLITAPNVGNLFRHIPKTGSFPEISREFPIFSTVNVENNYPNKKSTAYAVLLNVYVG